MPVPVDTREGEQDEGQGWGGAILGLEKIPLGQAALAQGTHSEPQNLPRKALKPLLFFTVTLTVRRN